jgi:competence protein ComEA
LDLKRHLTFDPHQKRVLTVLLFLLIAAGFIRLAYNPIYIADPQPAQGDLASQLATRLDPNTATAAELSALPGLGEKRAIAIVAQREKVLRREPTTVPFKSLNDLLPVNGIGAAMIENLRPFLAFPTDLERDKIRTTP